MDVVMVPGSEDHADEVLSIEEIRKRLYLDGKEIHINPAPVIAVYKSRNVTNPQTGQEEIYFEQPIPIEQGTDTKWVLYTPETDLGPNIYIDFQIKVNLDTMLADIDSYLQRISQPIPQLAFFNSKKPSLKVDELNNTLTLMQGERSFILEKLTLFYRLLANIEDDYYPDNFLNQIEQKTNATHTRLKEMDNILKDRLQVADDEIHKLTKSIYKIKATFGIDNEKLQKLLTQRDKALRKTKYDPYLKSAQELERHSKLINTKFRRDLAAIIKDIAFKTETSKGIGRFFKWLVIYWRNYQYTKLIGTEKDLGKQIEIDENFLAKFVLQKELLLESYEKLKSIRSDFKENHEEFLQLENSARFAKVIYYHVADRCAGDYDGTKKFVFDHLADNPSIALHPELITDLKKIFAFFIANPRLNIYFDPDNVRGVSRTYVKENIPVHVQQLIDLYDIKQKELTNLQLDFKLKNEQEQEQQKSTKQINNAKRIFTIVAAVLAVVALILVTVNVIYTDITEVVPKYWAAQSIIYLLLFVTAVGIIRSIIQLLFELRLIGITGQVKIDKDETAKLQLEISAYTSLFDLIANTFIHKKIPIAKRFQFLIDYWCTFKDGGQDLLQGLTADRYDQDPKGYMDDLLYYINSQDFYDAILNGRLPLENVEGATLFRPVFNKHENLFFLLYQKHLHFNQSTYLADGQHIIRRNSTPKCEQLFFPGYTKQFFEYFSEISNKAISLEVYRKPGMLDTDNKSFIDLIEKHTSVQMFESEINLETLMLEVLLYIERHNAELIMDLEPVGKSPKSQTKPPNPPVRPPAHLQSARATLRQPLLLYSNDGLVGGLSPHQVGHISQQGHNKVLKAVRPSPHLVSDSQDQGGELYGYLPQPINVDEASACNIGKP